MVRNLQQNSLKMINRFLVILLLYGYNSFGQGSYIEAGVNNTSYSFSSEYSSNDFELDSSTGIFLRVGLGEIIDYLDYGFSYQQFNSLEIFMKTLLNGKQIMLVVLFNTIYHYLMKDCF